MLERLNEFTRYYRSLNEYVILYELLYGKIEEDMYRDFIEVHHRLYTDSADLDDEHYYASLEYAELLLRRQCVKLIDDYFNCSMDNFSISKNNNPEARASYDCIVRHIRESKHIDIHMLTDCIQAVEQALPMLSSCLKIMKEV
jgi:putative heme degradation protein